MFVLCPLLEWQFSQRKWLQEVDVFAALGSLYGGHCGRVRQLLLAGVCFDICVEATIGDVFAVHNGLA